MNLPGITFGPVPSRRLGRSLRINNIPLKVCSYSCTYCHVGKHVEEVQCLFGYEGNDFSFTGNVG